MRSKSEAKTTLDRINRYIGGANEIFMDNVPDQTGYNSEIQKVEREATIDIRTTEPYYPLKNKAESVIGIIKGKSKRGRD